MELTCAPVERLAAGRIKGALLRAHLDWVRHHCSREETIEFFESLPAALRHELTAVVPTSWHSFATLVAVDRIVMDRFGSGHLEFLEELGAWCAQTTLDGASRFFGPDHVHESFARSAVLPLQYQDFGDACWQSAGRTSGRMVHRGFTSYSPLYCSGAAGFYRECVRLHGRSRVTIAEVECLCQGGVSCTFELAWQ